MARARRVSIGKRIKGILAFPVRRLTAREKQVIRLVSIGLRNRQIAQRLKVSVRTVEKHRELIKKKSGLSGAAVITQYAILTGISTL